MKRFRSTPVLALLLLNLQIGAQPQSSPPAIAPFKNGDAICFVGDSITRGGWFHAFIYQFYATRFPNVTIRTFNCGKSGDNATGTLARLPWDCLQHKPNIAVVMLGMNDSVVKSEQTRPIANLEKLVLALKQAGCQVIQIGPTIYDETADIPDKKPNTGKEKSLADYSEAVREMAARLGNGFVDFNAPMLRINMEHQKTDAKFSLIGADRVHPNELGHFVMAYEFLKAQGMPRDVSRMVLDTMQPKPIEQENCKIEAMEVAATRVRFVCTEGALPFVPTEKSAAGLDLVPFTRELNNQTLLVRNLAEGKYELLIDDQVVAEYSSAELAQGINLAMNAKTPQYQQSLKITHDNARRHDIESISMRGVALVHGMLLKANINPEDEPASEKYLKDFIAAHANEKGNFGKTMAERYLQSWNKDREKNQKMIDDLIATIRKEAAPVAHRWELRVKK